MPDTRIIEAFLKSRRNEQTKEYSLKIIEYLINQSTPENDGWIRSKILKSAIVPDLIPNDSSFFKLLKDMEQYRVIEKRIIKKEIPEKGKSPTYYRVSQNYGDIFTLERYELHDLLKVKMIGKLNADFDLFFSKMILNHLGVKNIEAKIEDLKNAWKNKDKIAYNKILSEIKKEIESSPT